MDKDYQQLWKGVTNAADGTEAVQALAKIVTDKRGRAFTLGLEPKEAELCVEMLDYVSCNLYLLLFTSPQMVLLGHYRAEPQNC